MQTVEKKKAIVFWSGGKDSALALYEVVKEGKLQVVALVTTVSAEFKRVSMHGVREELAEEQAKHIVFGKGVAGLPLEKMYISSKASNEEYEKQWEKVLLKYKKLGVELVVFGDIFLEDLKVYRENFLGRFGMQGYFPLWKRNTKELVTEFIDLGFKSIICCTNASLLNEQLIGEVLTTELVNSFPANIDPCGENGEFHTFAFDGPIFNKPIQIEKGERVLKVYENNAHAEKEIGFWFVDLKLK